MRFSFDEAETVNNFLERESVTPNKEAFIQIFSIAKAHAEDQDLTNTFSNIIEKVKELDEERYNKLVTELPVENLSNY